MNRKKKAVSATGAGWSIGSHLCGALVGLGAEVSTTVHYHSRNDWGILDHLQPQHKKSLHVVPGHVKEEAHFMATQIKGKEIVLHLASLIAIPDSYPALYTTVLPEPLVPVGDRPNPEIILWRQLTGAGPDGLGARRRGLAACA